jgi:hypothetical protein
MEHEGSRHIRWPFAAILPSGLLKGMAGVSKHRGLWLAAGALFIVIAVLALIIGYTGVPELLYTNHVWDGKRVDDLRAIAIGKPRRTRLPATLGDFPPAPVLNLNDPVTKATYEYRPIAPTTFELCATFASADDSLASRPRPTRWEHPQGPYCYKLDTRDAGVY